MAEAARAGLVDLEKELSCSICTEVLYQPLTLLDCLHTFCGSCLKEWFHWQAQAAASSSSRATKLSPFTCPSCRAQVRETRPNATVTTLLEMYLQANPQRARTDKEKENIAKAYTPGENVLPKIKKAPATSRDMNEQRMVEEARELSLREVGIRGTSGPTYERGIRHRAREGVRTDASAGAQPSRQIEHQTSLRSILSSSSLGEDAVREDILRQIMDEGLLDGIDLTNLDVSQEDELSERIAEAYRRRHPVQARRSLSRDGRTSSRRRSQSHEPNGSRQREDGSGSIHRAQDDQHSPRLLEANSAAIDHRRLSSERRRQTSPTPASHSRSPDSRQHTARSASDLSDRPRSSEASSRPRVYGPSRNSGSTNLQPTSQGRDRASQNRTSRSPRSRRNASDSQNQPATSAHTSPNLASSAPSQDSNDHVEASPSGDGRSEHAVWQRDAPEPVANVQATPTPPARTAAPRFSEPSISCKGCGAAHLEYELHWDCNKCDNGSYDICNRCYLTGKGCLHWYGFGHAALPRYERQAPPEGYPANHEPPHRLTGHCYRRLNPRSVESRPATMDPVSRLQSGPFCSNCHKFCPECYWRCSYCNEGEWGFCNECVNRGKCCTHPLLPFALSAFLEANRPLQTSRHNTTMTSFEPASASLAVQEALGQTYTPLTISTHCDMCRYPIPPSTTRFHCPQCHEGDYDLCVSCYLKLVKRGTISHENGPKGWRRCPRGHRMIIVGFQDAIDGQQRVVVEELIGGQAMLDHEPVVEPAESPSQSPGAPPPSQTKSAEENAEWEWKAGEATHTKTASTHQYPQLPAPQAQLTSPTGSAVAAERNDLPLPANHPQSVSPQLSPSLAPTQIFPPSGGLGLRAQAVWSYWPSTGVTDELGFPKGAELSQCERINEDWFFGWYCGKGGLFPGGYVRVVGGRAV